MAVQGCRQTGCRAALVQPSDQLQATTGVGARSAVWCWKLMPQARGINLNCNIVCPASIALWTLFHSK
jgi:hypothetical protein